MVDIVLTVLDWCGGAQVHHYVILVFLSSRNRGIIIGIISRSLYFHVVMSSCTDVFSGIMGGECRPRSTCSQQSPWELSDEVCGQWSHIDNRKLVTQQRSYSTEQKPEDLLIRIYSMC